MPQGRFSSCETFELSMKTGLNPIELEPFKFRDKVEEEKENISFSLRTNKFLVINQWLKYNDGRDKLSDLWSRLWGAPANRGNY